jgi:hypothetical protein
MASHQGVTTDLTPALSAVSGQEDPKTDLSHMPQVSQYAGDGITNREKVK